MDCKLKGVYSYDEAKLLATGTLKEKDKFSGDEHPIFFAILENGQYVGIINMWPCDIDLVRGFRDVWVYGEKEPEIQTINFISKNDTSKVRDFTLYLYKYTSSGTSNKNSPSHINSYD